MLFPAQMISSPWRKHRDPAALWEAKQSLGVQQAALELGAQTQPHLRAVNSMVFGQAAGRTHKHFQKSREVGERSGGEDPDSANALMSIAVKS